MTVNQQRIRPIPATFALSASVTLFLTGSLVLWSVSYRGIFSDGANLLLEIIERRTFDQFATARISATYISQFPVVAAIGAGMRSVRLLMMIYTFSLGFVPALCYSLAIWVSRREPVFVCATVTIIVTCLYPVSFLLVGQGNMYMALFWLSFVMLLDDSAADNQFIAIGLLLLSIASVAVYETSTFFSAILAYLAAYRSRSSLRPNLRPLFAIAAIFFVFGTLVGSWGAVFPRDARNESGFVGGMGKLLENKVYLEILILAALAGVAAFLARRSLRMLVSLVVVLGASLYFARQLHESSELALGYVINQRAQVWWVALFVVTVSLALWGGGFLKHLRDHFHPLILGVPLLVVFALDAADTLRWRTYMDRECEALNSASSGDRAFFNERATKRYGISWTFPTTSVLLRSARSTRILVDPGHHGWQPFDPKKQPDIQEFKNDGGFCS